MIRRELSVFLMVGVTTVLVDFLTYHLLLESELMPVDSAKAASFLTGTAFAYFANRYWTFGHKTVTHRSIWKFLLLYGLTLAANVGINALILRLYGGIGFIQLAFLIATGVSAALNFVGMKFFVFKERSDL